MKRIHLFFIAALCAVSMSAQMRIWNNGQKLFEINLSMIDSVTFVKSGEPVNPDTGSVTPPLTDTTMFDYDHWREQTTIRMYDKGGFRWVDKYLPWHTELSSVTMPESYRYPNKEFHNDTVPVWELAFNLFPDSTIDHGYMFGLWDRKSQTMRIYSYLDQLPNENATYCFYYVNTSSSCFVEPDAKAFMPSDSILQLSNSWNIGAIANAAARPSTTDNIVQPIQRDENMPINSGWACFDLNLSSGNFNLPENGTISFSLYGVEQISFEGTDSLGLALNCDSCGGTQTGQIVTPPNKAKQASGIINSIGSFLGGLASTAAACTSVGTNGGTNKFGWGVATAIVGGLGALCNVGGAFSNGYAEDDTVKSTLSTKLSLSLNFGGTAKGKFEGQLSSVVGTHTADLTMSYGKIFEEILNHASRGQASQVRRSNDIETLSHGVWNLKKQPVLYVCKDTKFDDNTLISFLDPSSIELALNKDNILFDYDEIDSIQLVAYDFAFVDGNYGFSAQPYYDYYKIPREAYYTNGDTIKSGLVDKNFLLVDTVSYQTYTKDNISYTGLHSKALVEAGLSVYNMVYSPKISTNKPSSALNYLGVAAVLEVTFKDGQKRIFAERFLPEIKTFTLADAQTVLDHIKTANAPTTIDEIPMECPLFDMQKNKAIRLLFAATHPVVVVGKDEFEDYLGIRIRAWQDDEHPGIVIRIGGPGNFAIPSCETMTEIYNYINSFDIHDRIGSYCGNYFDTQFENVFGLKWGSNEGFRNHQFFIQNGVFENGTCYQTSGGLGLGMNISIYHEDAGGNLTLVSE